MKKKMTAILLTLVLVLSLGACGDSSELSGLLDDLQEIGEQIENLGESMEGMEGLENLENLVGSGDGESQSGGEDVSSGGDSQSGDEDINWGELSDQMDDIFGRDDDVPYQFPDVATHQEWPGAEVWEEMGVIDLTPEKMENGYVYNGGDTYVEGYVFGFTAECESDKESFDKLAQKLWDAGYRNMHVGNGLIAEAQNMEQLMEENPNYYFYRAYYEHNGAMLQVELQKTTFNDTFWAGVFYAPSLDEFEVHAKKGSWPSLKSYIGADLPELKGTAVYSTCGDEEEYALANIYVEGVSQAAFDAYIENLSNGGAPGIAEDSYQQFTMGEDDTVQYKQWMFYTEKDGEYFYIDISYVEGIVSIEVIAY